MANLAKTTAEWIALFREMLQFIRIHRELFQFARRFLEGRTRVLEVFDTSAFLSLWTIVGAKRGVNVSEDGRLFVKVTDETPGAGQARIQLYSDSAQTALVAQGDAADGATATLAAQNNSGLTGTVKLATITSSPTNIQLLLDIDEDPKGVNAFSVTTASRSAFRRYVARLTTVATALASQASGTKSDFEQGWVLTKLAEFFQSSTRTVISSTESADDNGDIQITLSGLMAELKDNLEDNAPAQSVEKNTVTPSASTFDPDNVGLGAVTQIAAREHAPPGRMTVVCTSGKDSSLEERFSVELKPSLGAGTPIRGGSDLTIKKEWESRTIGIRFKLIRTITDTLDGGAQVDTYVVNGETLDNTDAGQLYLELTAGAFPGGDRRVKLFKDAAKSLEVARGERTGNGVVTLAEMNGSGLTGSCNITYAVDDLDIVVNLNPFAEGEFFTFDVTNDRAGIIQSIFADLWQMSLPSAVPASATLKDEIVKEGVDHVLAVS